MSSHEGRIKAERDDLGYDIGKRAICSCGWHAPDLRPTPGQALQDLFHHTHPTLQQGDTD